ncbi:uncharacterized protein C8Q71DRAFT_858248 [Rhodofomes roseus]|uniref:Uncharacterized protein n=1 Tax=Rhodofomes roseus TaxID=34475 RepID=A0ABQ8KET4_9APHY|nr:uncharacterized protein C8Q71DRAFT_858248 [Rhodofomes roseus]KAH9836249.1 hypothetical protein C8Q71DRAFT_858248 [Rhodofomes roseus]
MSRIPAVLVSSKLNHSARVKHAFNELNKYAASSRHGATLGPIKVVHETLKSHPRPRDAEPAQDDLVNRLINDPDNHDLWFNQLLGNPFCKEMGMTGPNDPAADVLLMGFKAYMVQDYIYCARRIMYQTERAIKSTTAEEFKDTTTKASHYCTYAQGALDLCVDDVDQGLGMKDIYVLQAQPADATNYYTDMQFETAKTHNWA